MSLKWPPLIPVSPTSTVHFLFTSCRLPLDIIDGCIFTLCPSFLPSLALLSLPLRATSFHGATAVKERLLKKKKKSLKFKIQDTGCGLAAY